MTSPASSRIIVIPTLIRARVLHGTSRRCTARRLYGAAVCTLLLMLLAAWPADAQQRGQRSQQNQRPAPAQRTTTPQKGPSQKAMSIAASGPRGIYVSCGTLVASSVHPVGDTVGYRIERREGRGAWTRIADISAVTSLTELRARIGLQPIDDAVRRMKLQNAEEFWKALLTAPRLEKILITPERATLEALGLLYCDTTVVKGTSYDYRVSMLLASGSTARSRESGPVTAGAPWPMASMVVSATETTDSSVRVTWSALAPRPMPSGVTVYRRMTGQEDFRSSTRPASIWKSGDSVYCTILEKNLAPSQQYELYAVPVDFFGNEGAASQTAVAYTVNFDRLPMPQNLRTEQDTFGIRISWTTDITEHLIATRIYRSLAYDTGYVLVAEVPATERSWLDGGAVGMTRYFYKIANLTYDNRESQRAGSVFGYGRSPIPPATPQGVRARPVTGGVALEWSHNAEPDIAGYYVCRAAAVNDSLLVVSPLVADTVFTDTSNALNALTQYRYAVVAVNHSQLRSGYSNIEIVRAKIATDPAPPRNLYARAGEAGIALNWNDPRTYDETVIGYVVYRAERTATREPAFAPVTRMVGDPERTSWFDSTAVAGRMYLYAVASVDLLGAEGKRTAPAEARIRIDLPLPPADLRASRLDAHVRLEWSEPLGDDIAEITIYRAERGREAKKLATVPAKNAEYVDKSVKSGTVYYYTLSCTNRKKLEGPRSDEVWATP